MNKRCVETSTLIIIYYYSSILLQFYDRDWPCFPLGLSYRLSFFRVELVGRRDRDFQSRPFVGWGSEIKKRITYNTIFFFFNKMFMFFFIYTTTRRLQKADGVIIPTAASSHRFALYNLCTMLYFILKIRHRNIIIILYCTGLATRCE